MKPGLCAECCHARVVRGRRSEFWLCALAEVDPGFRRYPRLPVLTCRGHTPGEPRPLTSHNEGSPSDEEGAG